MFILINNAGCSYCDSIKEYCGIFNSLKELEKHINDFFETDHQFVWEKDSPESFTYNSYLTKEPREVYSLDYKNTRFYYIEIKELND